MDTLTASVASAPPWAEATEAAVISAERAESLLTALEAGHTRFLDTQVPAAGRLEQASTELGRADLARRARLVRADHLIRSGDLVAGSALVQAVHAEAEGEADSYALARSYFLAAWAAYSIGDAAGAQLDGIRGVELLPPDAPRPILVDHLVMLAIAYNPAPEAARYFDEALAITRQDDDPIRTISLLNNVAYAAAERGERQRAVEYVAEMQSLSAAHGYRPPAGHLETIARIYHEAGRFAEAVQVLEPLRGAAFAQDAESTVDTQANGLTVGLVTLAAAHRGLGEFDTAEMLLDRAAELASAQHLASLMAQIMQERARIAAARGDFESAFHQYVAFHRAFTALRDRDQQARARIAQVSFEADRDRRRAHHFRELAMRDALTGLYNRRFMDDLVTTEATAARASGRPLSLAIIDADFFKRINDMHSHEVGDRTLQLLARVLLASRPQSATVCRLGGEEFVLVMPGAGRKEAIAAAEAVRAAVSGTDWSPLLGDGGLTVSIGVTTTRGGFTSRAALLSDADRNLYAAKRSGRNRVLGDRR